MTRIFYIFLLILSLTPRAFAGRNVEIHVCQGSDGLGYNVVEKFYTMPTSDFPHGAAKLAINKPIGNQRVLLAKGRVKTVAKTDTQLPTYRVRFEGATGLPAIDIVYNKMEFGRSSAEGVGTVVVKTGIATPRTYKSPTKTVAIKCISGDWKLNDQELRERQLEQ